MAPSLVAERPRRTLWALIGLTWLVILPRLVPGAFGDHGTFISVADRLRAGDRLYVDAWDNKDPLFYYALAVARAVTPYGDVLLEVLWLGLAALAAAVIARSVGLDRTPALLAGGVLTPIILTGTTYMAGLTHLPAAAGILWIAACALRQKWLPAGVLLALLLFLKLTAVPVALTAVVVIAIRTGTRPGPLLSAGLGAVLAAGGVIGILAARGELTAYVSTQRGNVSYAQGGLLDSKWGPVVGHLLKVAPEDGRTGAMTTIGLAVLILLGTRLRPQDGLGLGLLWWLTFGVLATTLGVLALTALWPHHVQLLYVPAVLAVILFMVALPTRDRARPIALAALVTFALLAGGAAHPYWYLEGARSAPSSARTLAQVSDEARALTEVGESGSYARLGTNDTSAHARGLGDWQLGCPRFHQYPFDPPEALAAVLGCLPGNDAVLVDHSFVTQPGQPQWNDFVDRARAILVDGFTCTSAAFGELCVKADAVAGSATAAG